jgi:tight adherence protein C
MFWPAVWIAGMVGYFAPNVVVNRRIVTRRSEHRAGFPDFMDLLVVCANAGLSMDAALTRVGRELADSYPSLSANIYMATLEMRAGRSLSDALEHLGERLGLDEARSFATLLQQSEEFGSNLSDALRVYSDDMRHKRLSSAEEKAHSLPAKLSVPLMLCVFPVVLIIIMLPVFVRLKLG